MGTAEEATGAARDGGSGGDAGSGEDATTRMSETVRLARFETGADGLSPPVAVPVPDGVTGFAIAATTDVDALLAIVDVVDPDGNARIADDWPDDSRNRGRTCFTCPWLSHLDRRAATFVLPFDATPAPGVWSVSVAARAPRRDGELLARPADTVSGELWFAWVRDTGDRPQLSLPLIVSAHATVAPEQVDAWLSRATEVLASADIMLTWTVRRFDATAAIVLDGLGGEQGAPVLADGDALHVVLATALTGPGDETVLAFSAGLPGPFVATGGPAATVFVNVTEATQAEVEVGVVIAHELAHQLGLQHTIENGAQPGGLGEDRLPDTRYDDYANLMHWDAQLGGTSLTRGQIATMRAHPRLRAVAP